MTNEKFCPFDQFATSCSEGHCGLYNQEKNVCGLAILPELKEALVAFIQAMGMAAENTWRQMDGQSPAYRDDSFFEISGKLLPKE
jgi:hypothetical protein